ncbi:peptide deformylase [Streptomyces microflavus]|uniref:peptide deformylase n=1 Tax=Streptomyces microflavus TaxID=1919 RepID=UPI003811E397
MLPNPKVTGRSGQLDEQYEGCLSFFDVRGLIPPLKITVETTTLTGETVTTVCKFGLACLIHHPRRPAYTARMRTGVEPISVEEYRQTGRAWAYEQ